MITKKTTIEIYKEWMSGNLSNNQVWVLESDVIKLLWLEMAKIKELENLFSPEHELFVKNHIACDNKRIVINNLLKELK